MRPCKLLSSLLIFILSCNNHKTEKVISTDTINVPVDSNRQVVNDTNNSDVIKMMKENSYSENYDTAIKGGFSITYYHDTNDQYLIYKKGDKIIDTIGCCSLGLLYKNLGYIGADFKESFLLINSFGSGNPYYIRLLDKETAKNLIPDGSAMIDVDTSKQILLYSKADVPKETDRITLFDIKKMKQKEYAFPKELLNEPEILRRMRLIKVTDKIFTIEYDFNDRTITNKVTYSR